MILVISPKNVYAAKRIAEECRIQNVECRILSAEELAALDFKIDINRYTALYVRNPYSKGSPKYIPQIIQLAKKFKKAGKKVVDENIAKGDLGKGKRRDYKALQKANVAIPKTNLETLFDGRQKVFPLVAKWIFGMKARGTFLIRSEKDFNKIPAYIPKKELMLQEYIEADYEYKVVTVGYKALPVVLRFDFNKKWGRVEFGQSRTVTIANNNNGQKILRLAEKASKALGRELAKVDILQKGEKFYVLEVNRFPGLGSFEKITKFNVFKQFVKYLAK